MRVKIVALLLFAAGFVSCGGKSGTGGVRYAIGPMDSARDFAVLRPTEMELDALPGVKLLPGGFRNNRSRVYLEEFKNSVREQMDQVFDNGAPAVCRGTLSGDTLNINTSIGFFGGYSFLLQIHGDQFNFSFAPSEQEKIFKDEPTDSAFKSQIIVNSSTQELVLDSKPAFVGGERVTGVVKFTTVHYFVKRAGPEETSAVDTVVNLGKVYFTCTVVK